MKVEKDGGKHWQLHHGQVSCVTTGGIFDGQITTFIHLGIREAPALTASSEHYQQELNILAKKKYLFC